TGLNTAAFHVVQRVVHDVDKESDNRGHDGNLKQCRMKTRVSPPDRGTGSEIHGGGAAIHIIRHCSPDFSSWPHESTPHAGRAIRSYGRNQIGRAQSREEGAAAAR